MTTAVSINNNTGDYPLAGYWPSNSGGSYLNHYCTHWPCPLCNPPVYNPPVYIQPTYIPYPVYVNPPSVPQITIGKIVVEPDVTKEEFEALQKEVKELKEKLNEK